MPLTPSLSPKDSEYLDSLDGSLKHRRRGGSPRSCLYCARATQPARIITKRALGSCIDALRVGKGLRFLLGDLGAEMSQINHAPNARGFSLPCSGKLRWRFESRVGRSVAGVFFRATRPFAPFHFSKRPMCGTNQEPHPRRCHAGPRLHRSSKRIPGQCRRRFPPARTLDTLAVTSLPSVRIRPCTRPQYVGVGRLSGRIAISIFLSFLATPPVFHESRFIVQPALRQVIVLCDNSPAARSLVQHRDLGLKNRPSLPIARTPPFRPPSATSTALQIAISKAPINNFLCCASSCVRSADGSHCRSRTCARRNGGQVSRCP